MHDLAHCSQKGRQSLDSLWLDLRLSFMQSLVTAGACLGARLKVTETLLSV